MTAQVTQPAENASKPSGGGSLGAQGNLIQWTMGIGAIATVTFLQEIVTMNQLSLSNLEQARQQTASMVTSGQGQANSTIEQGTEQMWASITQGATQILGGLVPLATNAYEMSQTSDEPQTIEKLQNLQNRENPTATLQETEMVDLASVEPIETNEKTLTDEQIKTLMDKMNASNAKDIVNFNETGELSDTLKDVLGLTDDETYATNQVSDYFQSLTDDPEFNSVKEKINQTVDSLKDQFKSNMKTSDQKTQVASSISTMLSSAGAIGAGILNNLATQQQAFSALFSSAATIAKSGYDQQIQMFSSMQQIVQSLEQAINQVMSSTTARL